MKDEYKKLKSKLYICPICKKKIEIFCVGEIIKSAPCLKCQLIQLGYRKNEINKRNKSI